MSGPRGSSRQRRSERRGNRIEQLSARVEDLLGLDRKRMGRVATRALPVAWRRTAFAVYVLFGNLRGRESRRRSVTSADVAAVDDFLAGIHDAARKFGFQDDLQLRKFRDELLDLRRAIAGSGLDDAARGRMAAVLGGPAVEKLAFVHPEFRGLLQDLANVHVDLVNRQIAAGDTLYDGTGAVIARPPLLSARHTYLASAVRLITDQGPKDFTDAMMVSFATVDGRLVLGDNVRMSIAVHSESKAPGVVGEANYQHADAMSRLAEARALVFVVKGRELRVRPQDIIFSPLAVQEVTVTVRGRFGGSPRVATPRAADDWAHSLRYHVPADDGSAQLRVVLSLRREALQKLLR